MVAPPDDGYQATLSLRVKEREKEGNLLAAWRTLRHKKPRRRSPDAATREYTYRSTPRLPSSKRGERVKPVPSLLLLSQGPDARSASARAAESCPLGRTTPLLRVLRAHCGGGATIRTSARRQRRVLAKKIAYAIKS
jgi:hypothetical protein